MAQKSIFRVKLYDKEKTLLLTVRVHADYYWEAPSIALNKYPEFNAAFGSVRIR